MVEIVHIKFLTQSKVIQNKINYSDCTVFKYGFAQNFKDLMMFFAKSKVKSYANQEESLAKLKITNSPIAMVFYCIGHMNY